VSEQEDIQVIQANFEALSAQGSDTFDGCNQDVSK
jgi:hypothetical protein